MLLSVVFVVEIPNLLPAARGPSSASFGDVYFRNLAALVAYWAPDPLSEPERMLLFKPLFLHAKPRPEKQRNLH